MIETARNLVQVSKEQDLMRVAADVQCYKSNKIHITPCPFKKRTLKRSSFMMQELISNCVSVYLIYWNRIDDFFEQEGN